MSINIIIDSEFKTLIPPLQADEYERLESSILAEGCRDALIVWQGHNILVDGHNRYEICTAHNIPYKVIERSFDSRTDVAEWMLINQLGRRNLTDAARIRAARRFKELLEAEAKERMSYAGKSHDGKGKPVQGLTNLSDLEKGNTRTKLAEMSGTSEGKFSQGEVIIDNAPQTIQDKWDSGDVSTYRAYQLTKALEKSPPDHINRIIQLCNDNDEKVRILNRLYQSMGSPETNGTFDEIMRTGGFAWGDNMQHHCNFSQAPIEAIQRGLKSIADYHRAEAVKNTITAREVFHSSDSNEWYTPKRYVDAARSVMGSIDLDCASSLKANEIIQAQSFYTIDDNGLAHEWSGNVWLNPPYGRDDDNVSNQAQWSKYLINQYETGNVSQAILLVNAMTDTNWFQPLWNYPICFTNHRIKFYRLNGEANSPTHGNAFVYFGDNVELFCNTFSTFGVIVTRLDKGQ